MEDRKISTADIRRVFDRQWIAVSRNGFSAIRPPSELQEDSDVLQGFADDNLVLLRRIVHMSEVINISYEDARFSKIQFMIPGFSDLEAMFPPLNKPETMAELREWIKSLEAHPTVPSDERTEDFLINAIFRDEDPINLRGSIRWPGFLEKVKRLDYMLQGYSCEAYKPDRTGSGGAKFTAPMPDDSSGFSVKLIGGVKEAFTNLLDYSDCFELDFCCYRDFSALDMYFTA